MKIDTQNRDKLLLIPEYFGLKQKLIWYNLINKNALTTERLLN
jgi:hypothetical protein